MGNKDIIPKVFTKASMKSVQRKSYDDKREKPMTNKSINNKYGHQFKL